MFTRRIWLGYLRQLASSNKGRMAHATHETHPQYDVSEKMRKLYEIKREQRETTKAYYQKIIMNPYRAKLDTIPFDPVLFRYNALMTCHEEYLKPNLTNMSMFLAFYIFPIFLVYWYLSYRKNKYEDQLRSGKIAYKNRLNRNVL